MHPLPFPDRAATTPESVYASKYDWLFRWAMHFCGNDHHEAEDLVQDVFMQLLVSWMSVRDIEHPEKFLYTYLKYAYLMSCRRKRRYSFQTLSIVDFESFHLSLRFGKDSDPAEMQDQLYRIAAYLNWRKLSTKSASILLLRFFHGFFPTEIMQIGQLTRKAVDRSLAQARDEVRGYLATPDRLHIMHHGAPPASRSIRVALPTVEFEQALRDSIFQARVGECLPIDALKARYGTGTPIECELLAHIVSCERCLDLICKRTGLSSYSERSLYEASGFSQREKPKQWSNTYSAKHDPQSEISMRKGHGRFREAYEHRPKALVVAVDGEVLAARDVNSKISELKVGMNRAIPTELIEIMSEQELPLLTLPIPGLPPEIPPSLRQEATLADGRSITLVVTFTASGALLEITYVDPQFETDNEPAYNNSQSGQVAEATQTHSSERPPRKALDAKMPWWRRTRARLSSLLERARRPKFFAAVMTAALTVAGVLFFIHRPNSIKPDRLLQQAIAAENPVPEKSADVIHQKVKITSKHRTIERDIYRDQAHRARPRHKHLNTDENQLEATLAVANMNWDDPLSSVSYRDWRDHAVVVHDTVERTKDNLLTLTTTVRGSAIAQETLTLRPSDFHPVERTVQFRDDEHIEVAELEYEVMPWSKANPDWFEPSVAGISVSVHSVIPAPHSLTILLTEAELNETELHTRFVLRSLNDDITQRLEIERTLSGMQVKGIVANEAQRKTLLAQLSGIAHITTAVRTFDELATEPAPIEHPRSLVVTNKGPDPSPLDILFESKGTSAQIAGRIAHQIFESSSAIEQSCRVLDELEHRFRSSSLTPEGKQLLQAFEQQERERLNAAIALENQSLAQAFHESGISNSPMESKTQVSDGLAQVAHANADFCRELLSQKDRNPRSAVDILKDISASVARLEQTINQSDPTAALVRPSLSSGIQDHK